MGKGTVVFLPLGEGEFTVEGIPKEGTPIGNTLSFYLPTHHTNPMDFKCMGEHTCPICKLLKKDK